jgi:hypothetical protein
VRFHDQNFDYLRNEICDWNSKENRKVTAEIESYFTEKSLFYNPELSKKMISIIMKYLMRDTIINGVNKITFDAVEIIQKTFRFFCLGKSDPWLRSVRLITASDFPLFNFYHKLGPKHTPVESTVDKILASLEDIGMMIAAHGYDIFFKVQHLVSGKTDLEFSDAISDGKSNFRNLHFDANMARDNIDE